MTTAEYPDIATAMIRSPGIGNSSGCTIYRLSFWYLLSSVPRFSDDDTERSYLEVFRQYNPRGTPGYQTPADLLWGNETDYALGFLGPGIWNNAEVEFSANAEFTLDFLAHHPASCTKTDTTVAVDSISTLKGTSH